MRSTSSARGFSLLEMAIALGLSGGLLGMVWQMMSTASTTTEAGSIAMQAQAVARAGQEYLNNNKTAVLAQAPALNDVIRIKVTSADTGNATLTDLQTAGYLPSAFVNQNSYGQSYAFYAQRQDAGAAGADASDRLVGLVITRGGNPISDQVGAQIATRLGSAGGFIFSDDNPAAPAAATTIRGTAGGWALSGLTSAAGWSTASGVNSFGTNATAGRIAVLTNMLPAGTMGGGGGGGGASVGAIDDLSDAKTDYTTGLNMFAGNLSGAAISTGRYNTAVGIGALQGVSSTSNSTALGYMALASNWGGGDSVAIGSEALRTNSSNSGNVAIGPRAGCCGDGMSSTVSIGYEAAYAGSGDNSVNIGWRAGYNSNASARGNVLIGFQAGSSLTSGASNVLIGSGTQAPTATSSNRLNIGNLIYGDLNTGQIAIGGASLATGVSFDVAYKTDSTRGAVGNTAQRPTCTAPLEGAQRWNSQTQTLEVCTGGAWMQPSPAWVPATGTPPTANPGSGYFVLTAGTWNGNLGGYSGANAKCLADLTANNWMGKAAAVAAGQLVASKVQAFMVVSTNTPQLPLANTTYYFAVSGNPALGGANMSTDASGLGPYNSFNWSAPNYFGSAVYYWNNNYYDSDTRWSSTTPCCRSACGGFTTANSSDSATVGYAASISGARWAQATSFTCDNSLNLVCIVNP